MSKTVTKRYNYRAYPTQGQEHALTCLYGCCRYVYNMFIRERSYRYMHGEVSLTMKMFSAELTELKKTVDHAWLRDVSAVALQQALRQADTAYENFFRGCATGEHIGYPKYRNRHEAQSAEFTKASRFRVEHQTNCRWGFVTLSKIGRIKFRWSRDLPSEPSSVTILRNPAGEYYVSFVVRVPVKPAPAPKHAACGIDLGVHSLAVIRCSDGAGEDVPNPRFLDAGQRRIKKQQRGLSRKRKGSKNYEKKRLELARSHQHVKNQRHDLIVKLAKRVTDENQAVALETLNVKGLTRKAKPKPNPSNPGQYLPNKRRAKSGLNRRILDCAWGTLIALITSMAKEKGRQVCRVDRWSPTTQTCSICGEKDGRKPLKIREWTCPNCGTHLDRDANAAVNIIVAAGLAETLNALTVTERVRLAQAAARPASNGKNPPRRNAPLSVTRQESPRL